MFEEFTEYVKAEKLLRKGDAVVAGVSGGADSVCLFLLLLRLKEAYDDKLRLIAVHINHGIRGRAADEDESFVEALCKEHNIKLFTEKADVPRYATEAGISEEEAGRIVRRAAFEKYGDMEFGTGYKIALAHHKDDNAETVLYRMARGTGLSGLGGISPKAKLSSKRADVEIIHPLLIFEKKQIEDELKEAGEKWRTDETNYDISYNRNHIRGEVIPALEKINTKVSEHIFDMSADVRTVTEYIKRQAGKTYAKITDEKGRMDAVALLKADEALRGEIILAWLDECEVGRKDITRKHMNNILDLAKSGQNGTTTLIRGISCVCEYNRLFILKERTAPIENEAEVFIDRRELERKKRLSIDFMGYKLDFELMDASRVERRSENSFYICMNYDKITDMCIRTRRRDDYIVIGRSNERKSVGRLMIDNKTPRDDRDRLPILLSDGDVLWVCGIRMSMDYYIDDDTQTALVITARKAADNE